MHCLFREEARGKLGACPALVPVPCSLVAKAGLSSCHWYLGDVSSTRCADRCVGGILLLACVPPGTGTVQPMKKVGSCQAFGAGPCAGS